MVSTEEIGAKAYAMLEGSSVKDAITGEIAWQRTDYSNEDVIIVPHAITGEGSIQFGQVKINIHVPDRCIDLTVGEPIYETNFPRLVELRKMCIEVLKSHYESGEGWNWTIGQMDPPIKEEGHNEHFVSLALEITARNRNNN